MKHISSPEYEPLIIPGGQSTAHVPSHPRMMVVLAGHSLSLSLSTSNYLSLLIAGWSIVFNKVLENKLPHRLIQLRPDICEDRFFFCWDFSLCLSLQTFFFFSPLFLYSPHPALLRYNWIITLCKFKEYNIMIWYMFILQHDYHHRVS